MKRRNFFQAGLVSAAATVLASCGGGGGTASGSGGSKPSVLVIGAGVAGLAAASQLAKQGYAVTVLEARSDRYGGRLWTDNSLGLSLDLGASWIHGVTNNPIKNLANTLGASMATTYYDNSVLFNSDGQLTTWAASGLDDLQSEVDDVLADAGDETTDAALYNTIWNGVQASSKSSSDQALLRFLMSAQYETEFGGSLSGLGLGANRVAQVGEMSTRWLESENNPLKITGDDQIFTKGYFQIAQYLASGLTIKLGENVTAIDYSGAAVKVSTATGSYSADRVLITVPLGVLKAGKIAFAPDLPTAHRNAIGSIGMGVLDKLYLQFDKAFWVDGARVENDTHWIESIPPATDTSQTWTEWVNFKGALNANVLLGFNAADAANDLGKLTDDAVKASAMARLKSIFGNSIPAPTGYLRTNWRNDRFTLGAYSFNAYGMNKSSRADLAAPVSNKLYFAGEATHTDYFGTVHGAYLSGLTAAASISG